MFDEAESSCQHAIEILEKIFFARLPVSGCSAKTPMPLYYRKRTEKAEAELLETRAMTYSAKFHERNNAKMNQSDTRPSADP